MPSEYDESKFALLREEAERAFLTDPAYAIVIARAAGALVARRKDREDVAERATQAYL